MKAACDRSHLFFGNRRWLGSDTYECDDGDRVIILHGYLSNPNVRPKATALVVDRGTRLSLYCEIPQRVYDKKDICTEPRFVA